LPGTIRAGDESGGNERRLSIEERPPKLSVPFAWFHLGVTTAAKPTIQDGRNFGGLVWRRVHAKRHPIDRRGAGAYNGR